MGANRDIRTPVQIFCEIIESSKEHAKYFYFTYSISAIQADLTLFNNKLVVLFSNHTVNAQAVLQAVYENYTNHKERK